MSLEKKTIIETSIILNKVKEIQAILARSSPPCCFVSKKHIGMTVKEITSKYQAIKIIYPSQFGGAFEIEFRSNNATITCHIVNNMCVEAYIFYDDNFAFLLPNCQINNKPN